MKLNLTNRVQTLVLACLLVAGLCGCAEDRTYQFEQKTSGARWIESEVLEWYLWADTLPEMGWKDYFSKGDAFLKKLTAKISKSDKWTYCAVDTTEADYHERGTYNHLDSYGLDVALMQDPTGATSRQYARVKTVYAGSPAERCGIERNDFIEYVDGTRVSSSNLNRLSKGGKRTLVVLKFAYDLELQTYYWERVDTVAMEASEYVEDEAFALDYVYDVYGRNVGYLMCNRLVSGAHERNGGDDYKVALDNVMEMFRGVGLSALIVDLRLCNYGDMEMARRLASYIVGKGHEGKTMLKTLWKESKSSMNEDITIDNAVAEKGLDMKQVYFITGDYTCGAAEWLVNAVSGLLGDENVFVVGKKTGGQNVMTHATSSEAHSLTLHLASAYVADASGNYDYSGGILPDLEIDEYAYADLYPYGDLREIVLSEVINSLGY